MVTDVLKFVKQNCTDLYNCRSISIPPDIEKDLELLSDTVSIVEDSISSAHSSDLPSVTSSSLVSSSILSSSTLLDSDTMTLSDFYEYRGNNVRYLKI